MPTSNITTRTRSPRASITSASSVPDLNAAVAWFDQHYVAYVKRPDQGKRKDVAFVMDPNGYWIEIVEPARLKRHGMDTAG